MADSLGPAATSAPSPRLPLIVLCAIGLAICGILLRMGTPGGGELFGAALCKSGARVNCVHVLASPWARIWGVPTAGLGLAYFGSLAAWFCFVGIPSRAGRHWHVAPIILVSLGLAGSLVFMFIMAFRLPVWCTWCMAGHLVNAALFMLTLAAWPRMDDGRPAHPSSVRGWAVIWSCIAVMAMAGLASYGYVWQKTAMQAQREYLKLANNADFIAWRFSQQPRLEVTVDQDDLAVGPDSAPHTLVIFTDFECYNCRIFHNYVLWLRQRKPRDLRIVFKHYPNCSDCNRFIPGEFHTFACEAAHAAEAARSVGTPKQAWDYYQRLFDNAERFASRPYEALAAGAGIDPTQFREIAHSERSDRIIRRDIEQAHELGVEGTPTIFLDGRRVQNWRLLYSETDPRIDVPATEGLWEKLLSLSEQGTKIGAGATTSQASN